MSETEIIEEIDIEQIWHKVLSKLDPTRSAIHFLLFRNQKKGITAKEIQRRLNISKALAYHHLGKMKEMGVIIEDSKIDSNSGRALKLYRLPSDMTSESGSSDIRKPYRLIKRLLVTPIYLEKYDSIVLPLRKSVISILQIDDDATIEGEIIVDNRKIISAFTLIKEEDKYYARFNTVLKQIEEGKELIINNLGEISPFGEIVFSRIKIQRQMAITREFESYITPLYEHAMYIRDGVIEFKDYVEERIEQIEKKKGGINKIQFLKIVISLYKDLYDLYKNDMESLSGIFNLEITRFFEITIKISKSSYNDKLTIESLRKEFSEEEIYAASKSKIEKTVSKYYKFLIDNISTLDASSKKEFNSFIKKEWENCQDFRKTRSKDLKKRHKQAEIYLKPFLKDFTEHKSLITTMLLTKEEYSIFIENILETFYSMCPRIGGTPTEEENHIISILGMPPFDKRACCDE